MYDFLINNIKVAHDEFDLLFPVFMALLEQGVQVELHTWNCP